MATVSSHTLDGATGKHAGGIEVRLLNLTSGKQLFKVTTSQEGRLNESIDVDESESTDRYELIFETTEYWNSQKLGNTQSIKEIVLRFSIPDAKARYHCSIILSPNSYSTWASLPE